MAVVFKLDPGVVTGEKEVALQSIQVVKSDQNVYPVPGAIAGPPCPGVYKYGELAFQVGWCWATGRQPVTVKNKC